MINDTFMDKQFRVWRIFNEVEGYYDCEIAEHLDGYILDTPKFKLFEKEFVDKKLVFEEQFTKERDGVEKWTKPT